MGFTQKSGLIPFSPPARRACELSHWKNPEWIDTLAAAYAQNGQFEEAAKWEGVALESPGLPNDALAGARRRLNGYQERCGE